MNASSILIASILVLVLPWILSWAIRLRIVKLPTDSFAYDSLMGRKNVAWWAAIVLGLILLLVYRFLGMPINLIARPGQFVLGLFIIVIPLVILAALQSVCPNCGRLLVFPYSHFAEYGGSPEAVEILRKTACKSCGFTFKKGTKSKA